MSASPFATFWTASSPVKADHRARDLDPAPGTDEVLLLELIHADRRDLDEVRLLAGLECRRNGGGDPDGDVDRVAVLARERLGDLLQRSRHRAGHHHPQFGGRGIAARKQQRGKERDHSAVRHALEDYFADTACENPACQRAA
jgi:hypothetical protein